MVVHTNSTNPTNPITGALKPSVSCSFASLGLRSRSLACHHPFSLPLPRRLWIFITFGARRLQTLLFFFVSLSPSLSPASLSFPHIPPTDSANDIVHPPSLYYCINSSPPTDTRYHPLRFWIHARCRLYNFATLVVHFTDTR